MAHIRKLTVPQFPNGNIGDWQARHLRAIDNPYGTEIPIVRMFDAWLTYADMHKARYESGIGEDGVLGLEWRDIGKALRGLLNGECGRLDCGTLDGVVCRALEDEGFNPDE